MATSAALPGSPAVRGKIFRFSNEQYTAMSGYFTKYEQDGDGELNLAELKNLVREVGGVTEGEELDKQSVILMNKLDSSGNQSLSFNEFLKGYERMLAQSSTESNEVAAIDVLKIATPKPEPKPEPKQNSELDILRKQLAESQEKHNREIESLKAQLKEAKENLGSCNFKVTHLETESISSKNQRDKLNQDLSQKDTQIASSTARILELEALLLQSNQRTKESEGGSDAKIKSLQDQVKRQEHDHGTAIASMRQQHDDRLKQVTQEKEASDQQLRNFKEISEKERLVLSQQNTQLLNEIAELKRASSDNQKISKSHFEELESLHKKLKDYKENSISKKEHLDLLKGVEDKHSRESDRLNELLKNSKENCNKLTERIKELEAAIQVYLSKKDKKKKAVKGDH